MSSGLFLYFLPGRERDSVTRTTLLTTPLAEPLADVLRNDRTYQAGIVQHFVSVGPNRSSGVLIAAKPSNWPDVHRVGYYPEEQSWRDCGDFWLGYVGSCKPGPESLQRETLITGYDYELGDEQIWLAPIIRYPAGSGNLPMTMEVDRQGQFVQSVVSSYAWAWELACKIWDTYFIGDGVTREDVFRFAVKILAVNYRVGPHECSALGLFNSTTAPLVLKAAIAEPMIREMMEQEESKKNQPVADTSTSPPGQVGG